MKKVTAIFFVLLANIIILAHAVLPHHHHGELFCVQETHCAHDMATDDASCTSEHNHTPNGNIPTTCALKQAVFIPASQFRFSDISDNTSDNHGHDLYIGYLNACELLQPISVSVSFNPRFALFLSSFPPSAFGLRAPPVV